MTDSMAHARFPRASSPHRTVRPPGEMRAMLAWIAVIAIGVASLAARPAWAQPVPGAPQAPAAPAAPPRPGPPAPPGAAPAAGAPPGAEQAAAPRGGRNFTRVAILVVDQLAYEVHPYLQYSGDPAFAQGAAATADTSLIGSPGTDQGIDRVQSFIHSLPPFGFESGQTTGMLLPKALTIGFDYNKFSQNELNVAGGKEMDESSPRLRSNTYIYQATLRVFALDPTEPGLNYFVGVGLGVLEGRMKMQSDYFEIPRTVSYGQSPVGSTRLGLETKGDNFGFRYELMLFKAEKVRFSENPIPGREDTRTIDFSGSLIRISVYYHFGDR